MARNEMSAKGPTKPAPRAETAGNGQGDQAPSSPNGARAGKGTAPVFAQQFHLEDQLQQTLRASQRELAGMRRRLKITYVVLALTSVGLLAFGVAMVGFPARSYFRGDIDELTFALIAGFGVAVLSLLLYFRPLERIQALAADSSYVSMIKDSFHYQVTLRLMAVNPADNRSPSRAAEHIAEAAQGAIDLVYTQTQARRTARV